MGLNNSDIIKIFNRSTGDFDIWLSDKKENRTPFVNAFIDNGIEGEETLYTPPLIAGCAEIVLDNRLVVDVMADLQFFKQDKFDERYQLV